MKQNRLERRELILMNSLVEAPIAEQSAKRRTYFGG